MTRIGEISGLAPRLILARSGIGLLLNVLLAWASLAQPPPSESPPQPLPPAQSVPRAAPSVPAGLSTAPPVQPVPQTAPPAPAVQSAGPPTHPAPQTAPPADLSAAPPTPSGQQPASPPQTPMTGQSPAPPPPHALLPAPPDQPPAPQPITVPAEQFAPAELTGLLGHEVVGTGGAEIGHIVDLLVDGQGRVRAVVVDVGGFMGVGSRKVAVAWSVLRFAVGDKGPVISILIPPDRIRSWADYISGRPVAILGAPGDGP